MFQHNYPAKAFVSRLILLHVQLNKRLVTMSIPKLSEESSKRLRGSSRSQISADSRGADLSEVVTSCRGGEHHQGGREFTEEELTIHRVHTQACEVRGITSNTMISSD